MSQIFLDGKGPVSVEMRQERLTGLSKVATNLTELVRVYDVAS